MKILNLLFLILMVISCQAKFNSHINQKDLPIKKCKIKNTNFITKVTNEKCDDKYVDNGSDHGYTKTETKPYSYEWQAFKGIVFNRDVNPFYKLAKSFSDHKEKRKKKAEQKKAKNVFEPQSENKQDGADSKKIAADKNDAKIKNEEN